MREKPTPIEFETIVRSAVDLAAQEGNPSQLNHQQTLTLR